METVQEGCEHSGHSRRQPGEMRGGVRSSSSAISQHIHRTSSSRLSDPSRLSDQFTQAVMIGSHVSIKTSCHVHLTADAQTHARRLSCSFVIGSNRFTGYTRVLYTRSVHKRGLYKEPVCGAVETSPDHCHNHANLYTACLRLPCNIPNYARCHTIANYGGAIIHKMASMWTFRRHEPLAKYNQGQLYPSHTCTRANIAVAVHKL